jgi:hypothetical protein
VGYSAKAKKRQKRRAPWESNTASSNTNKASKRGGILFPKIKIKRHKRKTQTFGKELKEHGKRVVCIESYEQTKVKRC